MPDLPLGNHVFDVAFHPQNDHVYAGLLTGEIKGFTYNVHDGSCQSTFTQRPTKRSCRGIVTDMTGDRLWSVSKDKTIHVIDTRTGEIVDSKLAAHESAINRVTRLLPYMFATGDDDGVIKLWDPRKPTSLREYKQHFDFISDFLWLEDKRQLVATSGDATLSVMDVRSNKAEPIAQSEDQEDELLSIVPIKGNTKFVIGTQLGILSIFNRNKGWRDCVDRIPGHPSSIDAMCALTSDVVLTGSSDGLIRAVQIFPTKFLGIIADHGEYPIERLKLDRHGKWLGSASHDEMLKMTNVGDALVDSDEEQESSIEDRGENLDIQAEDDNGAGTMPTTLVAASQRNPDSSDSDAEHQQRKKRRKTNRDSRGKHKKNTEPDRTFFLGL